MAKSRKVRVSGYSTYRKGYDVSVRPYERRRRRRKK